MAEPEEPGDGQPTKPPSSPPPPTLATALHQAELNREESPGPLEVPLQSTNHNNTTNSNQCRSQAQRESSDSPGLGLNNGTEIVARSDPQAESSRTPNNEPDLLTKAEAKLYNGKPVPRYLAELHGDETLDNTQTNRGVLRLRTLEESQRSAYLQMINEQFNTFYNGYDDNDTRMRSEVTWGTNRVNIFIPGYGSRYIIRPRPRIPQGSLVITFRINLYTSNRSTRTDYWVWRRTQSLQINQKYKTAMKLKRGDCPHHDGLGHLYSRAVCCRRVPSDAAPQYAVGNPERLVSEVASGRWVVEGPRVKLPETVWVHSRIAVSRKKHTGEKVSLQRLVNAPPAPECGERSLLQKWQARCEGWILFLLCLLALIFMANL